MAKDPYLRSPPLPKPRKTYDDHKAIVIRHFRHSGVTMGEVAGLVLKYEAAQAQLKGKKK
jgi:hypothetical protein